VESQARNADSAARSTLEPSPADADHARMSTRRGPHLLAVLLLTGMQQLAAQASPPSAPDPATTITAGEIGEHIEVLASDLLEGREAGTRGERRAALYIVSILETCPQLQPDGPDGAWLQPFELSLQGEPVTANNVLARLPGSDPALAQECIVVGAHYDHVGFGKSGNSLDYDVAAGEIHNGADDNASGSAVLLDLATSLCAAGWTPRRTILFQWYSGEELGLLGSQHWVKHPTHPLADVTFMINMDMVGRLRGRTFVVGGTGTAEGLSELAQPLAAAHGLNMLDDPPGGAPSDNSSFYDAGIPALFLFTGLHDDYHRAGDDSGKIQREGAQDIGRFVADMLKAMDARDSRPVFRSAPGTANIFVPRLYLGGAFDDSLPPAPIGARLAVLIPDGPVAAAGLREGDIVADVNGRPAPDVAALQALLVVPDGPVQPLVLGVWRPAAPTAPREEGGTSVSATSWSRESIEVLPLVR
jgi:Peptidase family M28